MPDGDKVALDFVARFVRQKGQLRGCFDAFGDDGQIEAVAEADDGANDRCRLRIALEIGNKGLVDLELVERKRLQIRSDEYPVPKSSMAMRTPSALRRRRIDSAR